MAVRWVFITTPVKLAENHALRNELRRQHTGPDKVQRIFQGRPEIMGQMFLERLGRVKI